MDTTKISPAVSEVADSNKDDLGNDLNVLRSLQDIATTSKVSDHERTPLKGHAVHIPAHIYDKFQSR